MIKQVKDTIFSLPEQSCTEQNKQEMLLDLDSYDAVANFIFNFVLALESDEQRVGLFPQEVVTNFDAAAKFMLLFDVQTGLIPESINVVVCSEYQKGIFLPNLTYKVTQEYLWAGLNCLLSTPILVVRQNSKFELEFDKTAVFDIETLNYAEKTFPNRIFQILKDIEPEL